MEQNENIVQTALDAGKLLATELNYCDGTPYAIIPNDHTLKILNELRERPVRVEQTVTHTTAQSFIDYYKNHGADNSVIFVDDKNATLTAIIDYHSGFNNPDWKDHRSIFKLIETEEWETWKNNNNSVMDQESFSRFIENNLLEIQLPTGAEMLEISRSIQAKTQVKFGKSIRLDNGQVQLEYNETIEGTAGPKGTLKIPEKFTIGLKLFKGCDPYQMEANLRYRIKDGALRLWYELIRPHIVVNANIDDTLSMINNELKDATIYFASDF